MKKEASGGSLPIRELPIPPLSEAQEKAIRSIAILKVGIGLQLTASQQKRDILNGSNNALSGI